MSARCQWALAAVVGVGATLVPAVGRAEPPRGAGTPGDDAVKVPAGQPALERARAAWEKGDYDVAEPLYAEAIEQGGLAPADVLEAYVHLGSARAVLGKRATALLAFKAAALMDLRFSVPTEAGKRAIAVADQARHLEARTGKLAFKADIPDDLQPGTSARIDVTLDAAHAALSGFRLAILAVNTTRPEADNPYATSVRAAPAAHFDLPKALSLPSTTLRVQVDWLDAHANRMATAEEQIHVRPLIGGEGGAGYLSPVAGGGAAPAAKSEGGRSGFWHSAWPYIIGGVALAAGGAAVYFATRSSNDVNVTGVRVLTH